MAKTIYTESDVVIKPAPTHDPRFHDLTGRKSNRLYVIGYYGRKGRQKPPKPHWWCLCECGSICVKSSRSIASGRDVSCGCYLREVGTAKCIARTTHGMTGTKELGSFLNAKRRCEDPLDPAYKNYGDRGIKFLFTSVNEYSKELGKCPGPNYTVDRIDNDGNYEPGNIQWATRKTQANNRRDTVLVEIDGVTKCLSDWSIHLGGCTRLANGRIDNGWCVRCSCTIPVKGGVCSHRTKSTGNTDPTSLQ